MRIRKWGNREITSVLGDGETGHRGAGASVRSYEAHFSKKTWILNV